MKREIKIDMGADKDGPFINVPLNKTDLMLISNALEEYREKFNEDSNELKVLMVDHILYIENKIDSNIESYDSLYSEE